MSFDHSYCNHSCLYSPYLVSFVMNTFYPTIHIIHQNPSILVHSLVQGIVHLLSQRMMLILKRAYGTWWKNIIISIRKVCIPFLIGLFLPVCKYPCFNHSLSSCYHADAVVWPAACLLLSFLGRKSRIVSQTGRKFQQPCFNLILRYKEHLETYHSYLTIDSLSN